MKHGGGELTRMGMRTYGRMSLVIWARCAGVSALRRSSENVGSERGRGERERTFGGGEPEQPDGEGVELVLDRPTVDVVLVEAFADEPVYKVGETGCVELAAVLAVVLQQHGEAGPERLKDVVCADVATADALDGIVVGTELRGEARYSEMAETTGGAGLVEGEAEHGGVEVVVRPEAEGVVEVLRGEEERQERGRGRGGVIVEFEDDSLEELEGKAEDGGRHGEKGEGEGYKVARDARLI